MTMPVSPAPRRSFSSRLKPSVRPTETCKATTPGTGFQPDLRRRGAHGTCGHRGKLTVVMITGNVLDQHEVAALQEAALSIPFEDGKKTAGRYVRQVKQNTQASASSERDVILAKVKKALSAHDVFQSAARPRYYPHMLISRYRSGMEYGAHVDDLIINGFRTDLSFTLFLSDVDSYQGGGLVIEDAILYPTSALHCVEPVTAGERLAVVGWVTSWVKSPAERDILYDLDHATRAVFEAQGKTPAFSTDCLKSKATSIACGPQASTAYSAALVGSCNKKRPT